MEEQEEQIRKAEKEVAKAYKEQTLHAEGKFTFFNYTDIRSPLFDTPESLKLIWRFSESDSLSEVEKFWGELWNEAKEFIIDSNSFADATEFLSYNKDKYTELEQQYFEVTAPLKKRVMDTSFTSDLKKDDPQLYLNLLYLLLHFNIDRFKKLLKEEDLSRSFFKYDGRDSNLRMDTYISSRGAYDSGAYMAEQLVKIGCRVSTLETMLGYHCGIGVGKPTSFLQSIPKWEELVDEEKESIKKRGPGAPRDESADQEQIEQKVFELIEKEEAYINGEKKVFVDEKGDIKPTTIRDYILEKFPHLKGNLSDRQFFTRVKESVEEYKERSL